MTLHCSNNRRCWSLLGPPPIAPGLNGHTVVVNVVVLIAGRKLKDEASAGSLIKTMQEVCPPSPCRGPHPLQHGGRLSDPTIIAPPPGPQAVIADNAGWFGYYHVIQSLRQDLYGPLYLLPDDGDCTGISGSSPLLALDLVLAHLK